MSKLKLGILISGAGSNLRAIARACEKKKFPAKIACVVSNRRDAQGLEFCKEKGIKHFCVQLSDCNSREHFESEINEILVREGVELICLAGFMHILGKKFIDAWSYQFNISSLARARGWEGVSSVINVHPSLLPAFPGLHAAQKALDAGVKFTGCTIHFVDHGMDTGPIIIQGIVPVKRNDNGDTLQKRIQQVEHYYYEKVIRLIAENGFNVVNKKVYLDDSLVHQFSLNLPRKNLGYESHYNPTDEHNEEM